MAGPDWPRYPLNHEAKFCDPGIRAVQRDIFPLPVPACESSRLKQHLGRKSQQRLGRALHKETLVADCVRALNDLYSGGLSSSTNSFGHVSAAQEAALSHIHNSVQHLGPPPAGLSGSEALLQLRAFDGYGEDQCPCNVKSYQPDLLSLPTCGNRAVPLAGLLGESGGNIVGDFCRSRLRDRNEACKELERSGVKQPYCDPCLRIPQTYRQFVQRLIDADLVELVDKPPIEVVEPFFVGKKDGRLRMVIDCRRSNCWFHPPDHTPLCTAEALSRIDLDEGDQLFISTADLKDAFYHFQLPCQLRDFFGMRPIFVDSPSADGTSASCRRKRFPRLKVLPMGWNHALFWCQAVHQRVVQEAGATIGSCLEDKAVAPDSEMFHIEYVDNFIVLGTAKARVDEVATSGVEALRNKGLIVHEVESSEGKIKVLGWEFDKTQLRPLNHRVWRVKLSIDRLLQLGRISGRQLEKVIGHASFICLGRREGLSVFGETYTFIHRHYWSPHRIWSSVRRELRIFSGILPLLWRDLASPWCSQVTATDASTWGLGATTAEFSREEIKSLGKFSERWRFEHEQFRKPRASAMGAAVSGDTDDADVFSWAAASGETRNHLKPMDFVSKKTIDQRFRNVSLDSVLKPWKVVGRYKWKRQEPIPVLEGRAALYAVKHAVRDVHNFHHRHLILSDSITAVCALDRGRGKSFSMRRVTQQIAALSLSTGCSFHYRWIPSEWNPADAPSRGSRFPVPLSELVSHGHPPIDPPAEPCKDSKTQEGFQAKDSGQVASAKVQARGLGSVLKGTEKETASGTAQGSGFTDSCFGGGLVPKKVCRLLEPIEEHNWFEASHQHESRDPRQVLVQHAQHHVRRGRGPESSPVHDGCQLVFQSPFEVSKADGASIDQADTSGLEEAGSPQSPSSTPMGSGVRDGRVGFQAEPATNWVDDAALFLPLSEARRSDSLAGSGCGTSSEGRPWRRSRVDSHSSPHRGAETIQDSRIRRDRGIRQRLDGVRGRGHSPTHEPRGASRQRTTLHQDSLSNAKVHGEGVPDPSAGESRGSSPLPPAPWRCKPGLPIQVQVFDGNSKEGAMEDRCLGEKIRERGQAQSATPRTPRRRPSKTAKSHQRHRTDRPIPALKPQACLGERVFLEIFSGSGRLGQKIALVTGWVVLLWDITLGPNYDLLNPVNRNRIRDWLRGGKILGFHLGTPCESFSRARDVPPGPPPLRSDSKPLGLEDLKPHDQIKVVTGNLFMRFSSMLLRLALRLQIPATMENPAGSRIWLCPPIAQILRRANVQFVITHYCAWGMPYKKPTGFLSVHLDLSRLVSGVCVGSKRGTCNFSHQPHIQLHGQNKHGQWLTKLAQRYPWRLCLAVAKCFLDKEVQTIAKNLPNTYNGRLRRLCQMALQIWALIGSLCPCECMTFIF